MAHITQECPDNLRRNRSVKVKEFADGALVLDGDIEKGAEEAFAEERYVEAYALLHGLIDWWMTDLYQFHVVTRQHPTLENAWDIIENKKWSFMDTLSYLSQNGIISDEERRRLMEFNFIRNKIVHRIIRRHYQTRADPKTKVTRQEAIDGFREGMALVSLLRERTGTFLPPSAVVGTTPEEAPA